MSWMDRPHKSSNLQIWNPYTSMNATWVTASLFSFQQIKSTFLSSRLLAAFFKDEVKAYEAYVIDTWTPKLLQHTSNATPETWNMKHETLYFVYFCGLGSFLVSVIFLSKAGRSHFFIFQNIAWKRKILFEYSYLWKLFRFFHWSSVPPNPCVSNLVKWKVRNALHKILMRIRDTYFAKQMNGPVTMQYQRTMQVLLIIECKAASTRFVGHVKCVDTEILIQLIGYVYSIQY